MTLGPNHSDLYYTIEALLADEPIESCKRHRAQDLIDGCDDIDKIIELYSDAVSESVHFSGWIHLLYQSKTVDLLASRMTKLGIIHAGLSREDVRTRDEAISAAAEWKLYRPLECHIKKEPEKWLRDYIEQVLNERET